MCGVSISFAFVQIIGASFLSRIEGDHMSVKYAVSRDIATQFRDERFAALHRNIEYSEIFQKKFR